MSKHTPGPWTVEETERLKAGLAQSEADRECWIDAADKAEAQRDELAAEIERLRGDAQGWMDQADMFQSKLIKAEAQRDALAEVVARHLAGARCDRALRKALDAIDNG